VNGFDTCLVYSVIMDGKIELKRVRQVEGEKENVKVCMYNKREFLKREYSILRVSNQFSGAGVISEGIAKLFEAE
jgi:hypothetical protein